MNQKLLIASTLVIVAAFAISFAAVIDNQANAQRGNVAQDANNDLRNDNQQRGLLNANVPLNANLQLNCAVNVLSDC